MMTKSKFSIEQGNMNRRDVLSSVAALSAVAAVGSLSANPAIANPATKEKVKSVAGLKNAEKKALIKLAAHCVMVGEPCLAHCFFMFDSGDTSLAECAKRTDDSMAVCSALTKLGLHRSSSFELAVKLCHDVCLDCEQACEKHKEHAICAEMAEACHDAVKACEAFLG